MLFSIQNLYERNWENWENWEKWNISTSPAIIINGINYSRYSVDELIKAGVLEDITDLVLEGEIIIE